MKKKSSGKNLSIFIKIYTIKLSLKNYGSNKKLNEFKNTEENHWNDYHFGNMKGKHYKLIAYKNLIILRIKIL